MELQEFVTESLKQIIGGVNEAQAYAAEHGAAINPQGLRKISTGAYIHSPTGRWSIPQEVEFDIAVGTSEDSKVKGGLGIFVVGFGAGGQGSTDKSNQATSRIKFGVILELPPQSANRRG